MVFEYSYWWILPAIGFSFVIAWVKFRKLSKLPDLHPGLTFLISGLRFLVIFTLLFLLLHPALSILQKIAEKPLLVLAQDNSLSLSKNKDSLYYLNTYKESLKRSVSRLSDKFEIVQLTFGDQVQREGEIDYSARHTDISAVFDYVDRNFISRRPEAIILLTDGIYNTGVNPRYKIPDMPVYPVLLGDTTCYPDVFIRHIETDKFNFIHSIFPIKAEIAALLQKGKTVRSILRENGKVIAEQSILIDKDNFLQEITYDIEARRKGIIHYSLTLETGFAERSVENNRAETWVNIIDNTGEVAIYTESPHPDVAAIKNAIGISGIYRCRELQDGDPVDSLKANLIIFHNPDPAKRDFQEIVKEAARRKISVWYILTERQKIADFAGYNGHYTVDFAIGQNEYAGLQINPDFSYFEFTNDETAGFAAYPPLVVPFGDIRTGPGRVLFRQKVKNVPTDNGVLAFYEVNGERIAYFWGEGLWRWRLYSYRENGNHELFNTLIHKIVGYLVTRQGADRFIHNIKPLYNETEEVMIEAELYNESYEPVNFPEVTLELTREEKNFSYLLGRKAEKYRLNLRNLLPGKYNYRLFTNLKGNEFEKKGVFYVRSHNPELNDMVADPVLLEEIARQAGTQLTYARQLEQLVEKINGEDRFKVQFRNEVKYIDLGELEILGLVLLILLCIEWFLLKYFAG